MTNGRFLMLALLASAVLCAGLQMLIEFSTDNVACACLVLASTLSVVLYMLWTKALRTHPLSTFALLGFCVTTQFGALLVQTAHWTPIALNLRQALETFATLAGFQLVALASHAGYRLLGGPALDRHGPMVETISPLRSLLQRSGLFATPSPGTLWIMGLIGLFCQVVGGHGEGVFSKVLQGFNFVAWAPFLIPMFVLRHGKDYCRVGLQSIFLAGYVLLIAVLAIAANARGMMLSGLMTIGLYALLTTLRNGAPLQFKRVLQVTLVGIVLAALTIPIGDLATAMVMARGIRNNAGPLKMVEETLYYLEQPQLLKAQQERDHAASGLYAYDESYFSSPLMGRLIETKFHDNALYFSSRLNEQDQDRVWNITGDFLWATLPDPMLKAMEIDVNKKNLSFSMGDYLSHLAGAGDLGGFKTGSGFAQGLAMTGAFFPLIYFFLCPILFWSHDLLSFKDRDHNVCLSALGMLSIWRLFQYGMTAESLQYLFMAVVRGLPQNILLYLLVFYFARWLARSFSALTGQSAQTALPGTTTPASEQPA